MAVLGLLCCSRAFSNWGERRVLLSVCHVWASHCSGISCCGAPALDCGFSSCMEAESSQTRDYPALADRLLPTGPPGKSELYTLFLFMFT